VYQITSISRHLDAKRFPIKEIAQIVGSKYLTCRLELYFYEECISGYIDGRYLLHLDKRLFDRLQSLVRQHGITIGWVAVSINQSDIEFASAVLSSLDEVL
jgi:hypothetical protein